MNQKFTKNKSAVHRDSVMEPENHLKNWVKLKNQRCNMIFIILSLSILVLFTGACVKANSKQFVAVDSSTDWKIDNSTNEVSFIEVNENTNLKNSKEDIVEYLKKGKKMFSLFSDNWTLIYHKDDRCDGSTDGQLSNLSNNEIDGIIKIKVRNDGDGWDCEKKEPKEFYLEFKLINLVKKWDRLEIQNYEEQEDNVVFVVGYGMSDYIKLYYDDNNLIVKMEYRSEDPG